MDVAAQAQIPQLINYQGRIAVGSANFNGSGQFKFALVDTTGATTYWSNDNTSTAGSQPTAAVTLTVAKGLYSVLLGDKITPIPASVFSNPDVRLRVWFNDGTHGFEQLTPDQRITAVGYAMMASSVPNGSITSSQIANGAVGTNQIAGGAISATKIANGSITATQLAASVQEAVQNAGYPVGPAGIKVVCIGDSLVYGVTPDSRQTWPAILSSKGFAQNGTVYVFGFSGYSTFSVNSLYSANQNIGYWPSGATSIGSISTCPANIGGSGNYAVIVASGSDYCGVYLNSTLASGSTTISGLSHTYYLQDGAGHLRSIAVGDAVSGTGIPNGTTVTAILSGSSLRLSNAATVNGTNLLTFTPSPTTSDFATQLTSLIGKCKASGYKVAVCTTTPAGNTATPADGVSSQGDFQANRLVYNNYVRGLTYDGAGSDPDILVDLAAQADIGTFNPALWLSDMLHPDFAGNQAYAGYINNALMSSTTPTSYAYPFGSEGITHPMLPSDVAYTDVANNFSLPVTIHPTTVNQAAYLYMSGGTDGSAGQYPADIFMQKTVGSTVTLWDIHSDGTINGRFQLIDSYFSGHPFLDVGEGAGGYVTLGDGSKTGAVTIQGGGAIAVKAAGPITMTGADISMGTMGKTLALKGGTDAASGTVTLSGGAATITSAAITTKSVIMFSLVTRSGVVAAGTTPLATVANGTASVSSIATDNSTYNWALVQTNQ